MWSGIGVLAFLIICCIVLFFVARAIYDGSFDYRCETSEENSFTTEEFDGLSRERHTFDTYQGHKLAGYLYESDKAQEKHAVVVFAHGMGGGGQRGFINIFNILCSRGYYVFAYDATANDESEGEVMGGLPQGFIDLDYAITYAQGLEKINELGIGPQGFGGKTTAIGLNIETLPTHIAGMPCAININCHVTRHQSEVI